MKVRRAWKYRLYPTKDQKQQLNSHLSECKNIWNFLLDYAKKYYNQTKKFPTKAQFFQYTRQIKLFSQVAQNVADKLLKSIWLMVKKRKSGEKAGFPRFKCFERMKSFTYPQFGFKLHKKHLQLSKIGTIEIRKHRDLQGSIKTLTIKRTQSGRWFAIFTTELEAKPRIHNTKHKVGIDLGIETFAYLSNGKTIENPRHLKQAEEKLKQTQRELSRKKKKSKNRRKAKLKLAIAHEKLTNKRRDFLHKKTKKLSETYSFIALEKLNVKSMSKKGNYLSKHIHDCSQSCSLYANMVRRELLFPVVD